MAKILTGSELSPLITEGAESSIEGIKYDFRVGKHILKAHFGRPIDAEKLSETEKGHLYVDPGEVVFILTEESLNLPEDVMAQLSPKRKLSHAGILTLGGFCIDPGYKGLLLLGLLSISSTPFPIRPLKKVIAATFYRLEGDELTDLPPPPAPLDDFPDDLVRIIREYKPLDVRAVMQAVDGLGHDLADLKEELRTHENWYTKFKSLLEEQNKEIRGLTEGLEKEIKVRASGQDKLTEAVEGIKSSLSFFKGAAWVIGLILAAAFAWFSGILGGSSSP